MAEASLATLISKFTDTAGRLNTASDSVNSVLRTVEDRLVQANGGVEAWLRSALTSTDAEGSTRGETVWISTFLGFAKLDSEWGLAVKLIRFVSGFFEGDTSCPYQNEYKAGEPVRLLKSSREIRIAALEKLPELIELLTAEADRCISTIEHAKTLAV
jgi:hypothetical protein